MNLNGFNAEEHETQGGDFDALPAGWYVCVINHSEERDTKSGTGSYLLLELDVVEGPKEGRKLWDRLNLNNPNPTAVEIAQRQLAAICQAVGVPRPKDSEELHDKPLEVKVTVTKYNGEDRNEVKAYRAVKGGASKAPAPSGGNDGKPPWMRAG